MRALDRLPPDFAMGPRERAEQEADHYRENNNEQDRKKPKQAGDSSGLRAGWVERRLVSAAARAEAD